GEQRIVEERSPVAPLPGGSPLETGKLSLRGAYAGDVGALVTQQKFRVSPPAILLADEILDGHAYVLEENVVDLAGAAVEQGDGTHAHAGTLHVDQQERDAGLLFRLRVRA